MEVSNNIYFSFKPHVYNIYLVSKTGLSHGQRKPASLEGEQQITFVSLIALKTNKRHLCAPLRAGLKHILRSRMLLKQYYCVLVPLQGCG